MVASSGSNAFAAVQKYFRAWCEHDAGVMAMLFEPDAKYEIRNKGLRMDGVGAITSYWVRNANRQKGLVVSWRIVTARAACATAEFDATFLDSEEGELQRIRGVLEIQLSGKGKIAILTEQYKKEVVRSDG